jgi:3-oxoacyl-[acyl-carrier protein] reductase
MNSLAGQIALVTGAGSPRGIGFATARLLAQDGATVAIVSTTERIHARAAELTAEGWHARAYVADLTRPEAVQAIIEDIRQTFGHLEICVNNAGMTVRV